MRGQAGRKGSGGRALGQNGRHQVQLGQTVWPVDVRAPVRELEADLHGEQLRRCGEVPSVHVSTGAYS